MKKFIIRVILFLLLVAVCDYAAGCFGEYAFNHARSGVNKKDREIRDTAEPDIVIFGSSRAEHHYVPSIIADSLQLDTYNMGVDGSGVLLMYPYLSQLLTRHTPSLIIYDILPNYDMYDDNHEQYLKQVLLLEGLPAADSIIAEIDPTISIKLQSRTYHYNSQYPSLMLGMSSSEDNYSQGYVPLWGNLAEDNTPTFLSGKPYSQLKLKALDSLISLCKRNNIRLIFTISPFYGEFSPVDLKFIAELCDSNNLEFINFSRHPEFIAHPELFADSYHLNNDGAELFTKMIVDSINTVYNRPEGIF